MSDSDTASNELESVSPSSGPALPGPRRLAGGMLVLSGFTHVAQLFVYEAHPHVIGAALFGVAYALIGVGLLRPGAVAPYFGAFLPAIGGALGVHRFLMLHRNPFSVLHVSIDLVVVPICLWLIVRGVREARQRMPTGGGS